MCLTMSKLSTFLFNSKLYYDDLKYKKSVTPTM